MLVCIAESGHSVLYIYTIRNSFTIFTAICFEQSFYSIFWQITIEKLSQTSTKEGRGFNKYFFYENVELKTLI